MRDLEELIVAVKEGIRQIGEVARQLEGLKIEVRGVKEELKRGRVRESEGGGGHTKNRAEEMEIGEWTESKTIEEGEEETTRGRRARNPGEKEEGREENGKMGKEEDQKKDDEGATKRGGKPEEEEGRKEGEKRWTKVQGRGVREEEEKERKKRRWEEELIERGKRRNNVLLRGKMDVEKMGIGRTEEIVSMALGKDVRIRRIVERMKRGDEGTMVLEMEDEEGKVEVLEGRKKLEEEGLEVKEDLTWWERKTRYRLSERAIEERARGRKVWMDSRTLKINGVLWRWDEFQEKWQEG